MCDDIKLNRISYSSLLLLLKCPRQYFFRYIKRIKKDEKYENKYITFGHCVHSILENNDIDNYTKYYKDFNLSELGYSINELKNSLDNAKMFLNELCIDLNKCLKEENINIKFNNFYLNGIIDLIDIKNDIIIDYKTGSYNRNRINDYILQLKFYSLLYFLKYNKLPKECILLFLKGSGNILKYNPNKNDIEEVIELINLYKDLLLYNNVNKNKYKPSKNNEICKRCIYMNECFNEDYYNNSIKIVIEEINSLECIIKSDNEDLLQPLLSELKPLFSYKTPNVFYINRALEMKGSSYRVPEITSLIIYDKNNNCLKTYNGFIDEIIDFFYQKSKVLSNKVIEIKYIKLIDKLNSNINHKISKDLYNINELKDINLREYQEEIIRIMEKFNRCLIESSVGSGKTVMAAEFIRRKKLKSLFVVDVKVLLDQTKNSFERMLGIKCGLITEGKQNWKDVNVATIQTIVKLIDKEDKEFLKNLNECGIIIIDEAHLSKSNSYMKLLKVCCPKYLIGITGTAFSNNGDDLELFKIFGKPKYKLSLNDLIKMGYATKPIIKFIDYKLKSDEIYTGDYNSLLDYINNSEEKIKALIKNVINIHKGKDNILIICSRINTMEILYNKIKQIYNDTYIIKGNTKKKEREEILNKLKTTPAIVIGSMKIVEKGLDIPNLKVLVNYTGNKGDIQTIQMIGRVIRKAENKNICYYYDFNDYIGSLKTATKSRKNKLKSVGLYE